MFLKLIVSNIILIFVLVGCSSGGGESGNSEVKSNSVTQETVFKVALSLGEYNGIIDALDEESITNAKEFQDFFIKEDPLEFFLKLKENNDSLKAEDMLNFMKVLEEEIVLKPLVEGGKITQNALDGVKTLDISILGLKSGPLRHWSSTDANETLSENAQELYNQEQWMAFNNELAAFSKPQLSYAEFLDLKIALKDALVLFANSGEAMQNVDVNATASKAPRYFSTKLSPSFRALSLGGGLTLNPVNETLGALRESPTEFLKFAPHQFMACIGVASSYPFQVMGLEYLGELNGSPLIRHLDISKPLLGDEGEKRFFQINQTGLAELLLVNNSSDSITIDLEHAGMVVTTTTLVSGERQKIFIPVRAEDVCVPYYLTKDDIKIEATVLRLQQPQAMEKEFDANRGAYDLLNTYFARKDTETFLTPQLVEFTISNANEGIRIIKVDQLGVYNNQVMQYIVEAPSGKLYSSILVDDGNIEVENENGKWIVYSLPMYGLTYSEYELDENSSKIIEYSVIKEYSNGYDEDEYSISISASETANLKEFVMAEMINAEFSHDGESQGSRAEVILSLHSNMAPKLELGEELGGEFIDDPAYIAYNCWNTHAKDIEQFDENQACFEMMEGLEALHVEYTCGIYPCNNADRYEATQGAALALFAYGESYKQRILLWYGNELNNKLNDERFKLMFDTYASIYDEWKNSVVQINDMQFPFAYHYGILDSRHYLKDGGNINNIEDYVIKDYYHPNIPINIPILAVTKERIALTSVPFAFEYSAHDEDEVDTSAQLFALAKLVVNQALAVATGNYAALVCNTVDTMKEMRQNEINGEDDPIGEADFFLNRFSSENSFYGLDGTDGLAFSISGLAEIPNHYTSYDKNLDNAALACDIGGAIIGGYNLYNSLGSLISGDFYSGLGLAELRADALDGLEEGSDIYNSMNEAFDALENGTATAEVIETLASAAKLSAFSSGVDIFNSISDATSTLGGLGGEGHNVMRSEANYFFSSFEDRKTRSNIEVKEVDGLPIVSTKVVLTDVTILNNLEKDDNAEVKLRTRVGVVSDGTPSYQGSFATNAPFMVDGELAYDNGANGYETLPNLPFKGYLLKSKNFNGISDGETLPLGGDMSLYDASYATDNNMAAIFVEIGLYEGDGGGVDDDMIGVFSKTFYLENLYNQADGLRWTHIGGRVSRLYVSGYPVYDAEELATSVEILNPENMQKQMQHNQNRINNSSARISFYIEVELGEYVDYEKVDTNSTLVDGDPNHGKSPMDMSKISIEEMSYLGSSEFHMQDNYENQVVMLDKDYGLRVASFDDNHTLSWRTAINSTNLPDGYSDLLDVSRTEFRSEKISGTTFIDSNHLLLFKRALPSEIDGCKLVVIDINEDNESVSVLANQNLENYAGNMVTMRVDSSTLKVFVSILNGDMTGGKIEIYDVTPSSIVKVGEQELLHTPIDMLAVDDKTLLVKYAKMKHRHYTHPSLAHLEHDEYWFKEMFLHLFEIDSANSLNSKDIRQFTYKHDTFVFGSSDTWYPPVRSPKFRMKNVNSGLLNRIVYTRVHNYQNDISAMYMNLTYNHDTGSYNFGSVHKARIRNPVENPDLAFYLDRYLNAYPSDLSKDGVVDLNITKLFPSGKQTFSSLRDTRFLDSRYALSLMHIDSTDLSRPSGDQLVLLRTTVDGKAPSITGDMLGTNIRVTGDNEVSISFIIVDEDSSVDDFTVEVAVNTIDAPVDYSGTTVSDIECVEDSNITYQCSGTISVGSFTNEDDIFNQKIIISISDGESSVQSEFTIYHKLSVLIPFVDNVNAGEMWSSDGEESGTYMVNDANPNGHSVYPGSTMYKYNKKYIYAGSANDILDPYKDAFEPYIVSPNEDAHRIAPSKSIGSPSDFVTLNNKVYFIGHIKNGNGSSTTYGNHLWSTDGTEDGTQLVKDMSDFYALYSLVVLNNKLYFIASPNVGVTELWVSDGTANGTKLVNSGIVTYKLYVGAGKLFFYNTKGNSDDAGHGIWSSDGTEIGTISLKDISGNLKGMVEYNGLMYFSHTYHGDESVGYDDVSELIKSDGTLSGTNIVSNLGVSWNINGYFKLNNKFYFTLDYALWESDGTDDGTVKIVSSLDFPQLYANSIRDSVRVINDTMYILQTFYDSDDEERYYKIYYMDPSSSYVFHEIDDLKHLEIRFYNESIDNTLLYYSRDKLYNYIWKYNPNDGQSLVKRTDR